MGFYFYNTWTKFYYRKLHPLFVTFHSGSLTAVKFVLEVSGIKSINDRDGSDHTPLMLATIAGHGDVVNYLLAQGGLLYIYSLA